MGDYLVVKCFSNYFDARQRFHSPANDFVSRAEKCNVFVGIGFLPVFPVVAGVVEFDGGHDVEVFQTNQVIDAFSTCFVEPRLPIWSFPYSYDLRNLYLSEDYAFRQSFDQAVIERLFDFGQCGFSVEGRQSSIFVFDFFCAGSFLVFVR